MRRRGSVSQPLIKSLIPGSGEEQSHHCRRKCLEQVSALADGNGSLRGPVQVALGALLLRCRKTCCCTAYPQDWIRTLGTNRIAKVHLKDFKFAKRQAEFVNLRDRRARLERSPQRLWVRLVTTCLRHGGYFPKRRPGVFAGLWAHRVDLILEGA
jgi:hypothetical protein